MTRPSLRVSIDTDEAGALAARLDLPDGPVVAYALLAHCFTCSKDLPATGRITEALTAAGIGVLRFDFTGLGDSGGDFADTDFSSNLGDLGRAYDWLRERHEAPRLLVGHSLGGAAVLALAGSCPELLAVATIGAPAHVAHVTRLFEADRPRIEDCGEAVVRIGDRRFTIRRTFLEDLARHRVLEEVGRLGAALLVLHAPTDLVVGIDNAARIHQAARHPKSFIALDGADHLLSDPADARFAGRMIAAWASRYVGNPG